MNECVHVRHKVHLFVVVVKTVSIGISMCRSDLNWKQRSPDWRYKIKNTQVLGRVDAVKEQEFYINTARLKIASARHVLRGSSVNNAPLVLEALRTRGWPRRSGINNIKEWSNVKDCSD